jgi:hypothetical protein
VSQAHIVRESEPHLATDHLTTPFEDWCEHTGVRPEESGAWEFYVFVSRS